MQGRHVAVPRGRSRSVRGAPIRAGTERGSGSVGRGVLLMRRTTKAAVAVGVAGTALLLMSGVAGAQDAPPTIDDVNTAVETTATSLNLLWVVIGAVLVIFMQAGFALVETGFCRAKHAAHVVSTNFAIFGLGLHRLLRLRLRLRLQRVQLRARSA